MYEFESRKHKSLMPDPSADNDKKAEMTNEEQGFNNDNKRDTLLCQYLTKQSICRFKKKSIKKCCIDISSYTPSKPYQLRLISSHLTSF